MSLSISRAETPQDLKQIADLFRRYQDWLGGDLCFQGFEKELEDLPSHYDSLLLGRWESDICGCVALKPYSDPNLCEMKRLYVLEGFRNKGIARNLINQTFVEARTLGYQTMCLETLPQLGAARRLYEDFGFQISTKGAENRASEITYMEKSL